MLYGIKVANSSCIISDDRGKNSFELAILSDLERIEDQYGRLKIEINGQKSNFEVNFVGRCSFSSNRLLFQVIQRKSQDESQRIWDNVNELQEEMNITKRNIEDIYDKDILRLQNLQNALNGDVRKLKFDLTTALEDHQGLGGGKRSSLGVSENLENLVLEVQEEVRQLKKRGMNNHGLSDSFRNELNSITIDIDELNKEKQANAIEIEQLKRHISKLEVEKVEENESQISAFGKKIEQLEASAGRTSQRMRRMGKSSGDSEKVDLLLKEVQTVKNQVEERKYCQYTS